MFVCAPSFRREGPEALGVWVDGEKFLGPIERFVAVRGYVGRRVRFGLTCAPTEAPREGARKRDKGTTAVHGREASAAPGPRIGPAVFDNSIAQGVSATESCAS
jgi:hypothetical protein